MYWLSLECLQQPKLGQAKSQEPKSHAGLSWGRGTQALESSPAAFQRVHWQKAESEELGFKSTSKLVCGHPMQQLNHHTPIPNPCCCSEHQMLVECTLDINNSKICYRSPTCPIQGLKQGLGVLL